MVRDGLASGRQERRDWEIRFDSRRSRELGWAAICVTTLQSRGAYRKWCRLKEGEGNYKTGNKGEKRSEEEKAR